MFDDPNKLQSGGLNQKGHTAIPNLANHPGLPLSGRRWNRYPWTPAVPALREEPHVQVRHVDLF